MQMSECFEISHRQMEACSVRSAAYPETPVKQQCLVFILGHIVTLEHQSSS